MIQEGAGQGRRAAAGRSDQRGRLEQHLGIVFLPVRKGPLDPGVAAQILGLMESAANPPDHRVPPVEHGNHQLGPAHPMIATAQMGQFVRQHHRRLLVVELAHQPGRQGDDRPASHPPDHGDAIAVDQPQIGNAAHAQLPGQLRDHGLPALRGRQRSPDHAIEPDDPPQRDRSAQAQSDDPGQNDRGERGVPVAADEIDARCGQAVP